MSGGSDYSLKVRLNRSELLLAALVVFAALCFRHSTGEGDDYLYTHVLEHSGYWEFLSRRYADWSGRTAIDAVTLLVISHVWVWRILDTVMVLTALYLTRRYAELAGVRCDSNVGWLLPLALPTTVLNTTLWWMTGSFNYLWPLTAGLVALWPFVSSARSRWLYALTIPAAAYACSQEQAGLLLISGQCVLMWRSPQNRANRLLWVQLAISAACYGVLLAAPGSRRRTLVQIGFNFPEYLNASLLDRVFSGVDLTITHLFSGGNPIALLFCILLAAVNLSQGRSMAVRVVSVTPLAVLLAPNLASLTWGVHYPWALWLNYIWSFAAASESQWIGNVVYANSPFYYAHFYLYLTAITCLAYTLYETLRRANKYLAVLALGLLTGACAVTAAVGLSPTLYASGSRIFLFLDWTLAFLTMVLFARYPDGAFKRALSVAIAFLVAVAGASAVLLR